MSEHDYPVICWQNLVTRSNIAATSAATYHPATDLANPATHLFWRGDDPNSPPSTTQYLTVSGLSQSFDYLAVASHNFGSTGCALSIEVYDETVSPATWTKISGPLSPDDDAPIVFLFLSRSETQARLKIEVGTAEPQCAVLYLGPRLTMQRRIYADHSPLPYARMITSAAGVSESGSYLGRVITRQTKQTTAAFKYLTPDWVRANLEPFLDQATENPFFFCWRPDSYPSEVGYAWLTNDPHAVPEGPSNMLTVELEMGGVA